MYRCLPRVLSFLALAAGLAFGCADDGTGGKEAVASAPQAIRTGAPEMPWITIGEDGRVVWFHANATTGAPNGISMEMPDGRLGYLAIDELSGDPLYWVAEGWVVAFRDWRHDEGLVDVGFFGPDGEQGLAEDVAFPNPVPPETLLKSTAGDDSGWATFVSALSVAVGGAVCAGGVIITGGAAIAGVTFPPGGVPLFAASWTGTAWACGTATIGFLALRPDSSVRELNDEVITPTNLGINAAQCVGRRDIPACLQGVGDAVSFVMSGAGQKQRVEVTIFLEEESDPGFGVYCCSGPTQIEQGEQGQWRAAVAEGLGTPPFDFDFAFDTDTGTDEIHLPGVGYSAVATYTFNATPATYGVRATATDDSGTTGNQLHATAAHPSLGPFSVRVYGPLTATLAAPASARAQDAVTLTALLSEGPRPLSWTLRTGDGRRYEGTTAAHQYSVEHAYTRTGTMNLVLEVRDEDGALLDEATAVIEVTAPSTIHSPECQGAKRHLCENLPGQQCDTSTMGRAVGRVSDACGAAEANRFAGVAELYCGVTLLTGFNAETCSEQ